MDDLNEKLSRVKDAHAVEVVAERAVAHEEKSRMEAIFMLGRIKQVGHDARSIFTALSSQEVRALEQFQQSKGFEALGYQTFVDFLEKSEYSPMSKRQYYDRLALIREHGDEIYDLLTSVGISVRAQKLLGKGDLAIRGDRLMVGDQEVEVGNTGVIKEVLEELFDERRELQAQVTKAEEKIEKQQQQIRQGTDEYERQQRYIDELQKGDRHDIALSSLVLSFLELNEVIGEISDEDKAAKAGNAIRTIWQQLQHTRKTYGVNVGFDDAGTADGPSANGATSDLVSKVLADDDDFGDDTEVAE